ncbi:unnamed protein product, partial [Staurois parvus]
PLDPPFSVLHPPLSFPPLASIQCPPTPFVISLHLASIQCPPPLSVIPSAGLHSLSSTPLCHSLRWPPVTGLHSVSSTPLCHSLHWPPFSVLPPSLSFPPLASTQCPSTPLCH